MSGNVGLHGLSSAVEGRIRPDGTAVGFCHVYFLNSPWRHGIFTSSARLPMLTCPVCARICAERGEP